MHTTSTEAAGFSALLPAKQQVQGPKSPLMPVSCSYTCYSESLFLPFPHRRDKSSPDLGKRQNSCNHVGVTNRRGLVAAGFFGEAMLLFGSGVTACAHSKLQKLGAVSVKMAA